MSTHHGIVTGILAADIAGIRTAGTNNNGVLKSDATNPEQFIEFPTDADADQFETDITGVGLGYTIHCWDIAPLLNAKKTSGFTY